MALDKTFVLGIFFVCLSFELGSTLKCYECSNQHDEKCGSTWGYEVGSSTYLTECIGAKVACKKLEFENLQQGGIIVTRSCWNTTDVLHEFEMTCKDYSEGSVCYCQGNGDKPCNGGQLLHTHNNVVTLILTGLSFFVLAAVYLK